MRFAYAVYHSEFKWFIIWVIIIIRKTIQHDLMCLIRHIWWHLTLWVLFMLYITLRRTLSESSFDWYTIAYCIWREFFSLRPQSMIKLFRSLLPRSVEKRLMGLRLEIEIGDWDWLRLEKQLAVVKGNESAQSVLSDRFDGMRHIGVLFMLYITLIWVIYHQSDHLSDTLVEKQFSTICLIWHIWWHETYMGVAHAIHHTDLSDISSESTCEWYINTEMNQHNLSYQTHLMACDIYGCCSC